MANIGRNDPCACGSGKKYKRCCYLAAVATVLPPTAPPADHHHNHLCDYCVEDRINRLADSALDLLLADRHDEAEAVCNQLMSEFPDEVEGIDMLAMVCEARGDRRRALELLRQAIDIADSTPDFDAETRSLMYERRIELETSQHA
jgi:SEC-C motif